MKLRKATEITLNLIFWVSTAWLIITSFSLQFQEIEIVNEQERIYNSYSSKLINQLGLCIFLSCLLFYANLFTIRQLLNRKRKIYPIVLSFSLLIIAPLLYFMIEGFLQNTDLIQAPKPLIMGIILFYYSISTVYGISYLLLQNEKRKQELMLEKTAAELNFLRNQLQPHFLFNALNNLLSMIDQQKQPALASSFMQLSKMLRYVVEGSEKESTVIQNEIDFIKSYCDLQKLRFESEEIDLQININGSNLEQRVEAGIFLPFVENAFKYGCKAEERSTIRINFDLSQKEQIHFRIENNNLSQAKESGSGKGIQNSVKRLEILYPESYELKIDQGDPYCVELKIFYT